MRQLFRVAVEQHELLWELTQKELKARYKRSRLGLLWAIINPLSMLVVYFFVFQVVFQVANRQSSSSYAAMLIAGLFPWHFFSHSLSSSPWSVLNHAELIKKVYFPRHLLVLASIASELLLFCITIVLVIFGLWLMGVTPTGYLLLIPPLIVLELGLVAGACFAASALAVRFRDIQYLINAVLMPWFYFTPVLYSLPMLRSKGLPGWVTHLIWLNPLAGLIVSWQQVLCPSPEWLALPTAKALLAFAVGESTGGPALLSAVAWTAVFLIGGLTIFDRREPLMADFV